MNLPGLTPYLPLLALGRWGVGEVRGLASFLCEETVPSTPLLRRAETKDVSTKISVSSFPALPGRLAPLTLLGTLFCHNSSKDFCGFPSWE